MRMRDTKVTSGEKNTEALNEWTVEIATTAMKTPEDIMQLLNTALAVETVQLNADYPQVCTAIANLLKKYVHADKFEQFIDNCTTLTQPPGHPEAGPVARLLCAVIKVISPNDDFGTLRILTDVNAAAKHDEELYNIIAAHFHEMDSEESDFARSHDAFFDNEAAEKAKKDAEKAMMAKRDFIEFFTNPQSGWFADPAMDGYPFPFSVICARPFRTYEMGTGVLMASGHETGFTAHGHEDVQVGDDPISHTHVCHFTAWYASVVTNPKRVAIAHDIFCLGYVSGESRQFIKPEEWKSGGGAYDPHTFLNRDGRSHGSIVAMLAPFQTGCKRWGATLNPDQKLQNPIDMSGSYSQCLDDCNRSALPFANLNNAIWEFNVTAQAQPDARALADQAKDFELQSTVNLTCFATMQKFVGGSAERGFDNTAYSPNTDHFGPDCIGPGSAKGRNGDLAGLKRFDYNKFLVEV